MSPMPSEQKSIRNLDKAETSFVTEECIPGMHAYTVLISCIHGGAAFIRWIAFAIKITKTEDIRSHHSHAPSRISIKQKSSKASVQSVSCLSEHSELCLADATRVFSSRMGKSLQSIPDCKKICRSITSIHVISSYQILESWRRSGP